MKLKRKIIEIDEDRCTGCGQCIVSCAEGALEIVNGKAKVVSETYCDGLGACLGHCPENALKIVQREAEAFDEHAVELRMQMLRAKTAQAMPATMACGCPSSHIQSFASLATAFPKPNAETPSALSHWPVQIALIPPTAPFLKGAELLVSADCTAFAYADFHRDFISGKVTMIGCPKFDDTKGYFDKFVQIFGSNDIKSVTVVAMEVPCCSKLSKLIKDAIKASGKEIALRDFVITIRGKALQRGKD